MKRINLLYLLIFFFNGCSKNIENNKNVRPVKYMDVINFSGQEEKIFTGSVQAKIESKLSFKLSGTVEKVFVKVGDQVEKNKILAQLDAATQTIASEEARSSLLQASAQHKNARLSYNRLRQLYEEGSASKAELDAAKANLESTTAIKSAAQKKVELAQLQIDYTKIKAPEDGSIASINIENNENISAGFPIISFASTGAPKIEIQVPENLIPYVKKETQVKIKVNSSTSKKLFSGFISEVGIATTKATSTFPVVVEFMKEAKEVRPGMSSEVIVNFNFENADQKTIIPLASVLDENGKKFVYVIKNLKNNTSVVKKQAIEIENINDLGVEIKSGITHGDKVVTAGVHQISDGQEVSVLENWKDAP